MSTDDRTETITDRAAIRDSADEREPERVCCDGGHANFPPLPDDPETTPEQRAGLDEVLAKVWPDPAPGATVAALDLDALHETICDKFTGMDEVQQAADALVAEVRSLRAKVAAVEALAEQWADRKRSDGLSGNAWIGLTLSGVAADLRAALATGEGK